MGRARGAARSLASYIELYRWLDIDGGHFIASQAACPTIMLISLAYR